ncbi:hypothetical protein THAOC_09878 [Thalassiosira oceanica]|uniref:Transmembrane protein n=1 Tax=Thalassiosira oceanica TaxID=159749 RepID=K0SVC6_THAOC|nr:hypothetical protein THAOC_09878 [Thalassiosira oceanica]|eukprot:EJK68914.1 hypothetical protein THAOC_09878 [Thalassiosira oceanica]
MIDDEPPPDDDDDTGPDPRPTKKMQQVYLDMHYRKMQRDLCGTQKKETKVFLAVVVTALGPARFMVVFYWCLVYWPLLTFVTGLVFSELFRVDGGGHILVYFLIAAEVLTIVTFIVVNYIYPKFVTSHWFAVSLSPRRYWNLAVTSYSKNEHKTTFEIEYDGKWGCLARRHHCRYSGQVNGAGLPHGQGVWSDDSYSGEILSGFWEDGKPSSPFKSRQYGGKGNTFVGVRLVYFMATDDSFESTKFYPTNENPPRVGVASVECSVAGDFMSHLPAAELVGEMTVEGENQVSVGSCCLALDQFSRRVDDAKSLKITSTSRGVSVEGHLFDVTGMPFTRRVQQIIVDVASPAPKYESLGFEDETGTADEGNGDEEMAPYSEITAAPSLRVEGWVKAKSKPALIFIPGFNSWLQHSLETFGQMIAMTQLAQNVYPILYEWPAAQVLTYRLASLMSASMNNRKNFLQLIEGLRSEGITDIHIITHSMGVQTLMAAFEDVDGAPSPVAKCFGPAPTLTGPHLSSGLENRLVCRSITLLNPDFPVAPFIERGFQTIRRVSSLITVVGDKGDQALFWSSLINGIFNRLQYSQPSPCDSRKTEAGFHFEHRVGRHIEEMCISAGSGSERMILRQTSIEKSIENASESNGEQDHWLDLDVIDTTGLDTNVNDLRHSAYNVNAILLR